MNPTTLHAHRCARRVDRATPKTRDLLARWQAGEAAAGERLIPLVYDQLRSIAARHLRRERPGHTLQPTALAHEALLRFRTQRAVAWKDRNQFLAYAARTMRQILIDHARGRGRQKRGGDFQRVPMTALTDFVATPTGLIALDDALRDLRARNEEHAYIVELRFFGGLTRREIAIATGTSVSTVERRWRRARAWLAVHLTQPGS